MSELSNIGVEIGEGSFGVVYLVEQNGEKFIRKVFRFKEMKNEVIDELKILLAIRQKCSPFFLCLKGDYDLKNLKINENGYYYFDTEYIEHSIVLDEFLERNKNNLSLNERICIIYMYLRAIYSFNKVAAHHDIKTPNILISIPPESKGKCINIVLIDYGLSCLLENDDDCMKAITEVSYVDYFPPEIYRQQKNKKENISEQLINKNDKKSFDAWESGLVIFNILFCKMFEAGVHTTEKLFNHKYINIMVTNEVEKLERDLSIKEQSDINDLVSIIKLMLSLMNVNPNGRETVENVYKNFKKNFKSRICDGYKLLSSKSIP